MRQLWPEPAARVDPVEVYASDDRPTGDRPWVLANMIATVDGAATDLDGRSGGLGGPADKRVFAAIRGVADVVLAGAATVAAEDYGPSRPPEAVRRARLARGQAPAPRIAVVSAALSLSPDRRLFREAPPDARPVVLTVEAADPERRRALAEVAEVHTAGKTRVEWPRALAVLRDRLGARVVLCEGGPTTIAGLVGAGLLDEMCLTVAPTLQTGPAPRVAEGPAPPTTRAMVLARALTEDGYLFLRYVARDAAG
ncbi:MAG TPA: dihydrofolate reductase family protein [Acidimicrobiales bacterium]|nr:dihydrofolate reductase family protein [Acidimicrobiales bacterium]